jgi:hypothetical protein
MKVKQKKVQLIRKWCNHPIGDILVVTEQTADWFKNKRHLGGPIGRVVGTVVVDETEGDMETASASPEQIETQVMHRKARRKRKRDE